MAQSFDDDLHIVENSEIDPALLAALAFPDDMEIIQALDDEPNDVGGLTAAELKAKFDEAGLRIQRYINEILLPAVLAADATEKSRAKAEAERAQGETARIANETIRQNNEASRVDHETERVAAEKERKAAELARESAEESRAFAETVREDKETGYVAQAKAEADRAAGVAVKTPYVGENGNWYVWAAAAGGYVDSGVNARGSPGVLTQVSPGMFAFGVSEDGHLLVAVNEGDTAPPLEIDQRGHLIYKINQ